MFGVEAIDANLRAALAMFARPNPSGATKQLEGVAVASSGLQFSMFNSAILTSAVSSRDELRDRIRAAGKFFRSRGLPWSFWVCEGWIENPVRSVVGEEFVSNGMHLVVELPGMAAERIAPPQKPLPHLIFRPVKDSLTRADFARIMCVAFGIPFAISRAVYESERTWTGPFTGWIGYIGDLPVTSTATLVTGDMVGVYAVGTLPTHQRKGCGEAIMRYALARAHETTSIRRTILQSSEAGYALYQRMGYRRITRYAVFATN